MPTFSTAERDRRWKAVAANAAAAGLDGILAPHCLDGRSLNLSLEQAYGARSDGRYLTSMEDAAAVIPAGGGTPIVINGDGAPNEWVAAPRAARDNSWAQATVQALREAGLERGRIGVTGLQRGRMTHGRATDGVVVHSSYAEVQRQLPRATFEDATDVVGLARYVKSEEEIGFLRQGAAMAVAGIEAMIATARPGVALAELYAAVMERMLELGSAYYPLALYATPLGVRGPRYENPPPGVLRPGDMITHETDAVVAGLIAQELQPILLGAMPEAWKPVVDLQRELFFAGMERMRPGTLLGELMDFVNGFGEQRRLRSLILMHGRGYGNDGPLLTPQDREAKHLRDLRLEAGNVWVWKPIAYGAEDGIEFSFGGCVLVTEHGGEQLVPRTPKLVCLA